MAATVEQKAVCGSTYAVELPVFTVFYRADNTWHQLDGYTFNCEVW
jgi:hypothetical protein